MAVVGDRTVLTSMRVIQEGFEIPQEAEAGEAAAAGEEETF